MQKLESENYIAFFKRVVDSVRNGKIDYLEMGDSLLGARNVYSSDNLRKAFYVLSKICDNIDEDVALSEGVLDELEQKRFDIQKERKKLQVINNKYQENARLEGRFELYLENIIEAINSLAPISIPNCSKKYSDGDGEGCLFISDSHYGRVSEIVDLDNGIINKYNPEEFERRMWNLLEQIEEDRKYPMYNSLTIVDCGDCIEGVLRSGSSLLNLKYGNIDSAIRYSEFMSVWICAVSVRLGIPVKYKLVGGNHDIMRILDGKPSFEEENIAKMILKYIAQRVENEMLKANSSGKYLDVLVDNYKPVCYNEFFGLNVMSYHGDSKNMKTDITFFENLYNIKIDILYGGHLHHGYEEEIGIASKGSKEVVRLPSICGIDDYAVKARKLARAGAKFVNFTERGKDFEKVYWLN